MDFLIERLRLVDGAAGSIVCALAKDCRKLSIDSVRVTEKPPAHTAAWYRMSP